MEEGKKLILIADDTTVNRKMLSDMLLLFWIFPREGVSKSVSSVIFIISNSCYYIAQLAAAHSISKSYS